MKYLHAVTRFETVDTSLLKFHTEFVTRLGVESHSCHRLSAVGLTVESDPAKLGAQT